ncbi:hypothetical protein PM082_016016 [Marasmius tenuissimus]|nr:hypothetical protein PM082_016016 [Marasmius tenuissimus]
MAAICLRLTESNEAVSTDLEGNLKQFWRYGFHGPLLLGICWADGHISRFLQQIQGHIDKRLCQSRISRFLSRRSESEVVRAYRDGLKHRLHTVEVPFQSFWVLNSRLTRFTNQLQPVQSDITIRELAAKIEEQQQAKRVRNTKGEPDEYQSYAKREGSNFHTTFCGFGSGSFFGNFRVDNAAGGQHNRSDESHSRPGA